MCWITRVTPKLEVAEEDIPVKKILLNDSGSLRSPIFSGTEWKLNVIEVIELDKVNYHYLSKTFTVEHGFHSCEDIHKNNRYFAHSWVNKCLSYLFTIDSNEDVFNAIIPKGSKYYKNEEGDYVSDKLMIIGK